MSRSAAVKLTTVLTVFGWRNVSAARVSLAFVLQVVIHAETTCLLFCVVLSSSALCGFVFSFRGDGLVLLVWLVGLKTLLYKNSCIQQLHEANCCYATWETLTFSVWLDNLITHKTQERTTVLMCAYLCFFFFVVLSHNLLRKQWNILCNRFVWHTKESWRDVLLWLVLVSTLDKTAKLGSKIVSAS